MFDLKHTVYLNKIAHIEYKYKFFTHFYVKK